MKTFIAFAAAGLVASPAIATGGLNCRTAGPRTIEVAMGYGHVPGAPLILTRLLDNGRNIPAKPAQWWLNDREVRLLLIDPDAHGEQLVLKAKRNGFVYDGSIWRSGQRRWVRCRES